MTIYEYGIENEKVILLLHPSGVMWDYFEYVIPLLAEDYHVIVPALPGYDESDPEETFTSVEKIADTLGQWLIANQIETLALLYGCSMGGSIAFRMVATQKIVVENVICDGAITPYQLPWLVTRLIAIKDFLMVYMGKIGGLRLLEKAFSTDQYSQEDLAYIYNVLRFMRYKTIWRTFESCNNYAMPPKMPAYRGSMEYWYGDKEAKARAGDIRYVRKNFPHTVFIKFKNMGHTSMAPLYPQEMAKRMRTLLES